VPRRRMESEISQVYMDMALGYSASDGRDRHEALPDSHGAHQKQISAIGGSVALNCVANGKVLRQVCLRIAGGVVTVQKPLLRQSH
jgi:hypothetical protein